MKITKKGLFEIIDTNGELIGNENIPEVDPNADTQANNTTDYNAKIGTQPYRYDLLGRFGFTLMPFMEGKEDHNGGEAEVINDLSQLIHKKHLEFLKYYYKNPNKLKSDYRKLSQDDGEWKDMDTDDKETAKEILRIVQRNLDMTYGKEKNIDESKVIEEKLVDKKEDEISVKSDDNEVREKKLEKIAGLINKLEKKDIDKLINLLERKE